MKYIYTSLFYIFSAVLYAFFEKWLFKICFNAKIVFDKKIYNISAQQLSWKVAKTAKTYVKNAFENHGDSISYFISFISIY